MNPKYFFVIAAVAAANTAAAGEIIPFPEQSQKSTLSRSQVAEEAVQANRQRMAVTGDDVSYPEQRLQSPPSSTLTREEVRAAAIRDARTQHPYDPAYESGS